MKAEGYFDIVGHEDPYFKRYVAFRNGEFLVLKTIEDLQSLFAPVTSPDEALSYALAATEYRPYYGLPFAQTYGYSLERHEYDYFEKTLEDTHVTEGDDGSFTVHLFTDTGRFHGCGPHVTYSVDIQVSRDGQITLGTRIPVLAIPENHLCIMH